MLFLRLKFESACLKYDEIGKESCGISSLSNIQDNDWTSPIGVDQVSNMLHVMFGLPPKPSKRKSVFQRNETIYNIAKNSVIKYDNYNKDDMANKKNTSNMEFFQTGKPIFNCHSKITTIMDGIKVDGHYSWNYFERRFGRNEQHLFNRIMSFFNETLHVDDVRRAYTFPEFVAEFHKHLGEKTVQEFLENELRKNGDFYGTRKPLNQTYVDILKNEYKGGSNGGYSGRTPLLLSKGKGRKLSLNGEIICPIDDEYVPYLEENGTLPTILDGGLITVVSCTKNVDDIEVQTEFMPLFTDKLSA